MKLAVMRLILPGMLACLLVACASTDRTLVVKIGAKSALRFSLATILAAFAAFGFAGTGYGAAAWWLGFALAAWLVVLLPWNLRLRCYPEKKGMYRALWAWGVTDIVWIGLGLIG